MGFISADWNHGYRLGQTPSWKGYWFPSRFKLSELNHKIDKVNTFRQKNDATFRSTAILLILSEFRKMRSSRFLASEQLMHLIKAWLKPDIFTPSLWELLHVGKRRKQHESSPTRPRFNAHGDVDRTLIYRSTHVHTFGPIVVSTHIALFAVSRHAHLHFA